jgi:hypothetical protein
VTPISFNNHIDIPTGAKSRPESYDQLSHIQADSQIAFCKRSVYQYVWFPALEAVKSRINKNGDHPAREDIVYSIGGLCSLAHNPFDLAGTIPNSLTETHPTPHRQGSINLRHRHSKMAAKQPVRYPRGHLARPSNENP